MKIRIVSLAIAAALLVACGQSGQVAVEESDLAKEARRIAESTIIVDTHIDVPMRLQQEPQDISAATDDGDFDFPRAVSGGLNAPFMSIYTAAELEAEGGSRQAAEQLIDIVEGLAAEFPDKFAVALSPDDIRDHFSRGIVSLPMGMENGSPVEGDLANLEYFYQRGIRYITLAHSLSNHISDSSYDEERQWGGLSEFGAEVVREMNRLGMMVDVSHVSDEAFWQVLDVTEVPVIASHSSARHFTPDFERNMNDEMIKALAENGGVIQINFGSSFVTGVAQKYSSAKWAAIKIFKTQHPELDAATLRSRFEEQYTAEHGPFPFATLEDILNHFDHAIALAGVDHVGIGSDYDGVGDSLPVGLKDVSSYPNLIEGLLKRGYSEEDIGKILGGNLLRVWEAVEQYAATAI